MLSRPAKILLALATALIMLTVIIVVIIAAGFIMLKIARDNDPNYLTKSDSDKKVSCINSGGKPYITTSTCRNTQPFFNSCVDGLTSCNPGPENYEEFVYGCECPEDMCFDGDKCIKFEDYKF